jgi:hypothetical protein
VRIRRRVHGDLGCPMAHWGITGDASVQAVNGWVVLPKARC